MGVKIAIRYLHNQTLSLARQRSGKSAYQLLIRCVVEAVMAAHTLEPSSVRELRPDAVDYLTATK